ncbi:helix-turn-helix domain-containing protein [Thermosulfidibacter takaii]|uniref:helix-turn-helix domain-containing protein n=1 Tax=Thermosulfidibacter takaii TaxID=412593 RepID=UPI000838118F|nr:helix-turn-helix domain-containing protein [Thermosulfidibacter takaii]
MKSFGELIKEKREKLGLTTEQLAERCGVPEEIIVAIENRAFLPPSFFLPALLRGLGGDETGELRQAYQAEAMRCFSFG